MLRAFWHYVCLAAMTAALTGAAETPAQQADKRLAVPAAAAQAEADRQIKTVFKDEYQKRGAAERTELAKRLLTLAQETKDDTAALYVALREAREVALSAGDMATAFAAIDVMAWTFAVDANDLKAAGFATAARSATTPDAAEKAHQTGAALQERLAEDNDYDAALKLAGPLEDLVRRANNAELARSTQARTRELRTQQTEWGKVKPHFDKLKASPDDAEAVLAVGKHHAAKGSWEDALPLLAKCSVAGLREAAAKDGAQPEAAEARADLGDLWWAAAEKETGIVKTALQNRAAEWYGRALDELTGLRKAQVEKRLQTAAGMGQGLAGWLRTAGILFWVSPAQDPAGTAKDLVSHAPATNVGAVSVVNDAGVKALKLSQSYTSYPATEGVKSIRGAGSAFAWLKLADDAGSYAGVLFRGTAPGPQTGKGVADFSIYLHANRVMVWFNWPENDWPGVDGKTVFFSKRALPVGKWAMCGVTWDGTTITIYVNGEKDNVYKAAMVPLKRNGPEIVAVGCDPAGAPEYFHGMMSSAMIFGRALTEFEVKRLHQASGVGGK